MRPLKPKVSLKRQMWENVKTMQSMAQTQEQRDRIAKDFPLPELRTRKPAVKREGLSELQEQIRVISWWDSACRGYGLLPLHLFAIPNGGSRGAIEAVNLKRSGVRPGVPDLMLAKPVNGHNGLFIEMKIEGGRVSPEQDAAIEALRAQGYKCAVCWSHMEAIECITRYLI